MRLTLQVARSLTIFCLDSRVAVMVSLITNPGFFNFFLKPLSQCHLSLPKDFQFFPEATVTVSLITTLVFPNFFLKPLSQCHWFMSLDFLFFSEAIVTVSLITTLVFSNFLRSYCHSVTDHYSCFFPNFAQKPLSQCHWLLPLDFLFFSKASVTVSLITALPNLT